MSPVVVRLAAMAFSCFAIVVGKMLVGLWPAVVLAGVLYLVLAEVLPQLESAAVVRRRQDLTAQLPLALELIAAAIAAGAPVVQAVELVAHAVDAPLGQDLAQVAAHLRLGAASDQAWASLTDPVTVGDDVASATRAVLRAERTGAKLAPALVRIAGDARAEAATRRLERAQRAGVSSALPLGVCFLPAFVCVGIVPIIITTLSKTL